MRTLSFRLVHLKYQFYIFLVRGWLNLPELFKNVQKNKSSDIFFYELRQYAEKFCFNI